MRAAVIQFPGSNCDRDMAVALNKFCSEKKPAQMVWHKESGLPKNLDLVAIPGGFSFGDYLRCGAIAARSPIMHAVIDFAKKGGFVLGVCNGFQVLTESGLLPGALMRNSNLKFVCKNIKLNVADINFLEPAWPNLLRIELDNVNIYLPNQREKSNIKIIELGFSYDNILNNIFSTEIITNLKIGESFQSEKFNISFEKINI